MIRDPRRLFAGLAVLSLIACGTALFQHEVQVSALGSSSTQVGIFDHQQGYTRDWAHKTLGTADANAPYSATLTTTTAVSVGSAATAKPLTVALAIPEVTDAGYFLLTIDAAVQQQAKPAQFCNYGEYFPSAQAPAIPLVVTANATNGSWRVTLAVDVARAKQIMSAR